jgi:two-component system, cell cycle response regulator DivK
MPDHRILIVEDNALVAKFYRMALERAGGFECLVTENVPEILSEICAGRVDLVVLDIALSNSEWKGRPIDGVELGQLIKSSSPQPPPILIATAHAMSGDRERLLASSGAEDYVEKPIYEAEVLVEKVRRLLDEGAKSQGRR